MNARATLLRRPAAARLVLLVSLLLCSFAHASEPDGDNDGVPDRLDKCPGSAAMPPVSADFTYKHAITKDRLLPGSKSWPVDEYGCEIDSDSDGVLDNKDYCPDDREEAISMGVAENGCPKHSDFDGTPDYRDNCPDTPKGVATDHHGCPK